MPDCGRNTKTAGLCTTHYEQQRQGKPFTPIRVRGRRDPICTVEGCEKPHSSNGYCSGHSMRVRNGRPLDTPMRARIPEGSVCSVPQCGNPMLYHRGFCATHNKQWANGLVILPIRGTQPRVPCSVRHCPKDAPAWSKLCTGHRNKASNYGLSIERAIELWAIEECDSCGGTLTVAHIDHDHACCPGAGSCGKCVRGVLCPPCNQMLGMAKDDPEKLRLGAAYLERATAHLLLAA